MQITLNKQQVSTIYRELDTINQKFASGLSSVKADSVLVTDGGDGSVTAALLNDDGDNIQTLDIGAYGFILGRS